MSGEGVGERRLLGTLESLLELDVLSLQEALSAAALRIAEALHADKVDAFLLDEASDTLIALGTSDTPTGRKQKALGLDRLPLTNGGRAAEVFRSGVAHLVEDERRVPGELRAILDGLGVRAQVAVPLEVQGARRGVLAAVSATPALFGQEDLRFLAAVARWVGVIAHRAELIEAVRRSDVERGRRAAAEELVTVLAHDLRNYLNPILGRVQALRMSAAADGRTDDLAHADRAIKSVQRLTSLIGNLLDVARLDHGLFVLERQPVDLVALATGTAAALATDAVRIEVVGPSALVVPADAERLRQALDNVVGNAVKHSPRGGVVQVHVGTGQEGGRDHAVLFVRDEGPGIPQDILPTLFERFSSGPGSSGLGLGLYIAHRIVEAHGGSLTVESLRPKGAGFRLVLPIVPPGTEPASEPTIKPAAS